MTIEDLEIGEWYWVTGMKHEGTFATKIEWKWDDELPEDNKKVFYLPFMDYTDSVDRIEGCKFTHIEKPPEFKVYV